MLLLTPSSQNLTDADWLIGQTLPLKAADAMGKSLSVSRFESQTRAGPPAPGRKS